MLALWRSEAQVNPLPRPIASGVRGDTDYLCPVCATVVFADMSVGQVSPGDKAFCPGCQTACEVPPLDGDTDAADSGVEG